MTLSERGLYRDLLDLCYDQGSIPSDPEVCRRLVAGLLEDSRTWRRSWSRVVREFQQVPDQPDRLTHRKVLDVMSQKVEYIEQRRKAASIGGIKSGNSRRSKREARASEVVNPTRARSPSPSTTTTSSTDNLSKGKGNVNSEEARTTDTEPSGSWSASDPWSQFEKLYKGPISDKTYIVFVAIVKTPELCQSLLDNTPMWMENPRYADGFHEASAFLHSGVWKRPPPITKGRRTPQEELMERVLKNGS